MIVILCSQFYGLYVYKFNMNLNVTYTTLVQYICIPFTTAKRTTFNMIKSIFA